MRSKSAVAERVLGPYLSHVGMSSTLADLAGHFSSVFRRVSNASRGYGKCLEPKAGLAAGKSSRHRCPAERER